MVLEICYHKFAILDEETGLYLSLSFTLFKMEFNCFAITHTTVSKQLLTTNKLFQQTALDCFSFGKEIEKVP